MLKLRPYQQQAVDAVFKWFEGDGFNANPLIVLPTGTGKSLVLADICRRSIAEYGNMKIVVVTHVMELIKQNHDEMLALWPEAPAGINSAGVGRREHQAAITFCGIQSVYQDAHLFEKVDFIIIDECHLLSRKHGAMYHIFIKGVYTANPKFRMIGLTATPFRMDSGMLHTGEDAMFDDIAYEYGVLDAIKQGYLSNLITKQTDLHLNVDGVHTRGGEFIQGELQDAVDLDSINRQAIDEIIKSSEGRKSWLIFGSGVQHCKHLAEILMERGITCATIFGETKKDERAQIIADFKAGKITALCSMGVLTTGFNAPAVDLIAMLRPTNSPGLYVQIVGRGMRTSPGKENCRILDFAGNIMRHGPIDQVRGRDKRKGASSGPMAKVCPECKHIMHLSCSECPECGYVFEKKINIEARATALPILSTGPKAHWLVVDDVTYSTHRKEGKPDSMKVTYFCGFLKYSEWICLQHTGYAQQKAWAWWFKRAAAPAPKTIAEALDRTDELQEPKRIQVIRNGKFDEIMAHDFAVPSVPASNERLSVHT